MMNPFASGSTLTAGLAILLLSSLPPVGQPAAADLAEWQSLFDGKALDGWVPKIVGHPLGEDPAGIFRAEDGVIRVTYPKTQFAADFGHLFTERSYESYRFRLEYRFIGEQPPGGPDWAFMNSGVMLHAQDPATMATGQHFPVSIEAQFLGRSDSDPARTTANICTPGTHVVIDDALVEQHCILSSTVGSPKDAWVRFEAEVRRNKVIRLFVNGKDAFTLKDPQFDENDRDAMALGEKGGPVTGGHIALQAESHPVEFRNIEIMVLPTGE